MCRRARLVTCPLSRKALLARLTTQLLSPPSSLLPLSLLISQSSICSRRREAGCCRRAVPSHSAGQLYGMMSPKDVLGGANQRSIAPCTKILNT
ncbi:hypothetical protein J4Q44_G00066780 [Coregonus suidteri]|uniref:Uncharacterized protein n=1 Tax=Coregonus suidteri TaxID=861788 RepID=A0AAN8N421_9TELE